MNAEEIGKIILYHRNRAGISRALLADMAGVGPTVIYEIERGKPSVRLDKLLSILGALNLSVRFDGPLMQEYYERQNTQGSGQDT